MRNNAEGGDRSNWYSGGLRFRCLPDCGRCCVNHGDHQYVYLRDDDAERLAGLLGMTVESFLERYTIDEDGWTALRMDRPECIFLEGTTCRVYSARPLQCSTFPFWRENLRTPEAWRTLRSFCPGIDEGTLHDPEWIRIEIERRDPD